METTQKSENNQIHLIKGDCFIIPNSAIKISGEKGNFYSTSNRDYWKSTVRKYIHECIECPLDTTYVQVWCCTPSSPDSNWCDHYEMPDKERFPSHLPLHLLQGHLEGDVIYIESKWGKIELTLAQLLYRYGNHGRFEQVLEEVLG